MGAIVRRKGIVAGLHSHGIEVVVVEVKRKKGRWPELLSSCKIGETDLHLFDSGSNESRDLIFFEGLPVAVGIIPQLIRLKNKSQYHVDICDSWIRSAYLGSGAHAGIKGLAIRGIKKTIAAVSLITVSRLIHSLSYISTTDLSSDIKWIDPGTAKMIVGNSADSHSTDLLWAKGNTIVCVADWGYGPNRSMLRHNLNWAGNVVSDGKDITLRIVGPNFPKDFVLPDYVDLRGWVENIQDAYQGASCSLSLISEGAGVKNKVIESLANGIPVIGTQAAFSSVPLVDGMCLITEITGPTADEYGSWIRQFDKDAPPKVAFSNWSDQVAPLIDRITVL
ncbi:glycosyltransferase family 4 protein [Arthrobacter sp. ERGS1:01]|uniref:glycosyltransferase family 4 protein n=1 Tax=Arthrobacter sp. ERGS1:01 TaxID=1704044 RepID=UPI0009E72B36|nr:glycosyltransferase family 4 protein [Arthrobacter sp. ERGS1:01]